MSLPAPIRSLLVVVPARDEEALIGRCLAGVNRALDVVRAARPGLTALAVVVADRCLDRTAERARAAGAHVVQAEGGCVGAARRAGVDAGVALLPSGSAASMWVASTDADTEVPPAWLAHQLELAALGTRLVIGRVVPDRRELGDLTWQRWRDLHHSTDVAAHVHGANLGFRLDDYLAAGGWPRLSQHEDRQLVDLLLAARVPAAAGLEAGTSARTEGRVEGGFSGYLRALGEPVPDPVPVAGAPGPAEPAA